MPAGQVRDGALVVGVVGAGAAVAVLVGDGDLGDAGAVEEGLLLLLGEVGPRRARVDADLVHDRLDQAVEVGGVPAGPRGDGALVDRQVGVGHDQLGVDLVAGAEAVAGLAGAVGRVEREVAGRQVLERHAARGAGEVLAEGERVLGLGIAVAGHDLDLGHALGERQGGLERVGEPALHAVAGHQPVDHHLDGVHLVALEAELEVLGQLDQLAVDDGTGEALLGQVLEQGVVGALAAVDHRGEHLEAGALGQLEDAVDDLLGRLAGHRRAVVGAVGHADAGEQQAQVVVDLGDGADRGARVAAGRLLVDGDRRRQALDEVDVGLVHLARGTGGRRRTATRRSGAGPRRRWCRTRASSCPTRTGR